MAEKELCPAGSTPSRGGKTRLACLLLTLFLYLFSQLAGLGHPLFWQDEGETAMFGQRVLEYGYPKVHAGGNRVFGIGVPLAYALDAESDAYTGSLWGQYYLAAVGVRLAQGVEDLQARTAWVRLPFALSGILGLGLFFLAIRPSFAGRAAKADAGIAFFLLAALSTSLILHLREGRYYAPALALLALIVWLHLRGLRIGAAYRLRDAMPLGFALFVLFNFFYPAAVAVAGWLILEALLASRRGALGGPKGWREFLPLAFALVLFAVTALGLASFFGMLTLSRILSERWAFGLQGYGANLFELGHFLLRHEFLAPWLALEGLLFTLRRTGASAVESCEALDIRAALLRLFCVYAGVGAGNPIFFERYFIPLGPLLILMSLLDCEALRRMGFGFSSLSTAETGPRIASAVVLLVSALLIGIRAPEWMGHLKEIREPVRGPVDAAIEYIRAEFPHPEELTIATNYEAEAYMYYLGSRVVGRFHGGTPDLDAAEAALRPDLVIPRMSQPRRLAELRGYLHRDRFRRHELNAADVAYNNIPELFPGRLLSQTHRFETAGVGEAGPPLAIYRLLPGDP